MKIKLDENLPERLADELRALGHDVDTVRGEHLNGQTDAEIWRVARSLDRFLITQDLDCSDLRMFKPGEHPGLLVMRLARPGREALVSRIRSLFATELVANWRGCLVVATDHKLRIKRPA